MRAQRPRKQPAKTSFLSVCLLAWRVDKPKLVANDALGLFISRVRLQRAQSANAMWPICMRSMWRIDCFVSFHFLFSFYIAVDKFNTFPFSRDEEARRGTGTASLIFVPFAGRAVRTSFSRKCRAFGLHLHSLKKKNMRSYGGSGDGGGGSCLRFVFVQQEMLNINVINLHPLPFTSSFSFLVLCTSAPKQHLYLTFGLPLLPKHRRSEKKKHNTHIQQKT